MKNPVVWFEVVGKDGTALRRFYSDLFGWHIDGATGDLDYGLLTGVEPPGIGGGVGQTQDGSDGHVTVFIEVYDPAAYLGKAEKLGATTVVPPTEVADYHLTFAYFLDPQGHLVGLSKGAV